MSSSCRRGLQGRRPARARWSPHGTVTTWSTIVSGVHTRSDTVATASNLPFSESGSGHRRPATRRCRCRPVHLQRPHHRNRQEQLPAANQPNPPTKHPPTLKRRPRYRTDRRRRPTGRRQRPVLAAPLVGRTKSTRHGRPEAICARLQRASSRCSRSRLIEKNFDYTSTEQSDAPPPPPRAGSCLDAVGQHRRRHVAKADPGGAQQRRGGFDAGEELGVGEGEPTVVDARRGRVERSALVGQGGQRRREDHAEQPTDVGRWWLRAAATSLGGSFVRANRGMWRFARTPDRRAPSGAGARRRARSRVRRWGSAGRGGGR